MLVLSRKSQEQIRIGESIVVTVLSIKGSSVRIGIEAPREVRVIRSELEPLDAVSVSESKSQKAAAAPVAAPVEMSVDVNDESAGPRAVGQIPAAHNRVTSLPIPMTQFVSRPR